MSKAKTASKNNPTSRQVSKDILFNGKKVKPVKIITESSTFFAAEYCDNSDLVVDKDGAPLLWNRVSKGKA